jgi:arabinofuranosyltransferase
MYLIYIGGDYMVGRFWAYPAFVAVWLVYIFIPANISPKVTFSMIAVLAATGAPLPSSIELRKFCPTACTMVPHPMIDAKWMFMGNLLFPKITPLLVNTDAHHKFVGWAVPLAKKAPGHVEKAHFIGMLGYYAGPGNILVDELALGDPLLSRMPVIQDGGFFIGHFKRPIPKGYLDAIRTGNAYKMDASLAKYYEKLRLITSGDLGDVERLKTIIQFNLGAYEHYKRDYLYCTKW